MKLSGILSAVIFSLLAPVANAKVFKADRYLYAGTLDGMVSSLQSDLANKIAAECGSDPMRSVVHEIQITLKRGSLAAWGPLEVDVLKNGPDLNIFFPSHPYAELSTEFECGSDLQSDGEKIK